MFGRLVDSPRRSCWMGDAAATYTYSRTRFVPESWTPALAAVRETLENTCSAHVSDTRFDSVLANLYRNGQDSMGCTCYMQGFNRTL